MNYSIGIDVGGTNTDAVLLDNQQQVIGYTKQSTTEDVLTGINSALAALLKETNIDKSLIRRAMLGTTHCTNAIVQRKGLNQVAHFRLGAPATLAIDPFTDVPDDFKRSLSPYFFTVKGGLEYNGEPLAALDEALVREHLRSIRNKVEAISVCGVFSPISSVQEQRVAELAREELGEEVKLSLSHALGSLGLLERENAAILNAALFTIAHNIAQGFNTALKDHQIEAEIFFGQNDGTLMPLHYAMAFPVLTIASGPTNSLRGASYLAQLEDAIVIDVGGTTSDIGIISQGFPRESSIAVEIGGILTNFRMPDIVSIGLGGGTIVTIETDGNIKIGPESVGYKLMQKALIFGGNTLTLTDIAVAQGLVELGDITKVQHLDRVFVNKVFNQYVEMIELAIDKMKTSSEDMPVILVGGGAILLPEKLRGASIVLKTEKSGVANAIGVSVAQVSGEAEILVPVMQDSELEIGLKEANQAAINKAVQLGAAANSIKTIILEAQPLAYMPGNVVRIRAKVAGELATVY